MRLAEDVQELGVIESQPLLEGRNMTMVLGPTKQAGEKAKTEAGQESHESAKDSGQVTAEDVDGAESASAEN